MRSNRMPKSWAFTRANRLAALTSRTRRDKQGEKLKARSSCLSAAAAAAVAGIWVLFHLVRRLEHTHNNQQTRAKMWTCTACRLEFETFNEQKEHFRADWHRYNLKRKVVELPPVTEEQFNFRMQKVLQDKQKALENDPKHKQSQKREEMKKSGVKTMTKCVACNKTFTTDNAHENHLTSKKHLANAKRNPTVADAVETIQKKLDIVSLDGSTDSDESPEDSPKNLTDEEVAQSLEEYKKKIPLAKEDCIFCTHQAEDFDANLSHMLKEHGFFIPDVEFLVNAEGLVGYLAEKVKLGNFCLYCNGKGKTFRDYHDVQKHMTALSHCKLPYDDDDDIEELIDFYDFSSQYASSSKKIKAIKESGETEGEAEWETDSEASIDDDEEVVEEEDSDDDEFDDDEAIHTINVSETGELVLASGKRLGRREFRRYYRQRFRPEEARESVLAATKERLLLAYQMAGVEPGTGSTALSLAFAANLLKKRNNIASGMTITESKRKNFLFQKHRERLDTRSHKFQTNPNRKKLVCV